MVAEVQSEVLYDNGLLLLLSFLLTQLWAR